MQGAQAAFKDMQQCITGGVLLIGGALLENRFGQLQIPVTIFVPDKFIQTL